MLVAQLKGRIAMLKFKFHIILTALLLINIARIGHTLDREDATCPTDHEPFKNDLETLKNDFSRLSDIETLMKEAALDEKNQQLREAIKISLDCKNNANTLIEKIANKLTENPECQECSRLIQQAETDKSDCENALSYYKNELNKLIILHDIGTYITKNTLPQDPKKSANNKASDLDTFLRETLWNADGEIQKFAIPTALSSSEDEPTGFYQDPKIILSVKNFRKKFENLNSPTEYENGWLTDENKWTWFGTETREFYPGKNLEHWRNYSKNTKGADLSADTAGNMTQLKMSSTENKDKFNKDPHTGIELSSFDIENEIDLAPVAFGLIDPKKMHWLSESREIYLPDDNTLIIRTYFKKKGDHDKAPTNDDESVTIVQKTDEGLHVVTRSYHRGQRYTNPKDVADIGPNLVWNPETTIEQYKTWKIDLFETQSTKKTPEKP